MASADSTFGNPFDTPSASAIGSGADDYGSARFGTRVVTALSGAAQGAQSLVRPLREAAKLLKEIREDARVAGQNLRGKNGSSGTFSAVGQLGQGAGLNLGLGTVSTQTGNNTQVNNALMAPNGGGRFGGSQYSGFGGDFARGVGTMALGPAAGMWESLPSLSDTLSRNRMVYSSMMTAGRGATPLGLGRVAIANTLGNSPTDSFLAQSVLSGYGYSPTSSYGTSALRQSSALSALTGASIGNVAQTLGANMTQGGMANRMRMLGITTIGKSGTPLGFQNVADQLYNALGFKGLNKQQLAKELMPGFNGSSNLNYYVQDPQLAAYMQSYFQARAANGGNPVSLDDNPKAVASRLNKLGGGSLGAENSMKGYQQAESRLLNEMAGATSGGAVAGFGAAASATDFMTNMGAITQALAYGKGAMESFFGTKPGTGLLTAATVSVRGFMQALEAASAMAAINGVSSGAAAATMGGGAASMAGKAGIVGMAGVGAYLGTSYLMNKTGAANAIGDWMQGGVSNGAFMGSKLGKAQHATAVNNANRAIAAANGKGGSLGSALGFANGQENNPNNVRPGYCDEFVAKAWGLGASGYRNAISHWQAIPGKYKHPGDKNPPKGALVFWSTPTDGHVALGMGGGSVASTDIHGRGTVATVSIAAVDRWLTKGNYLGWAEPFFGGVLRGTVAKGGGSGTGSAVALGMSSSAAGYSAMSLTSVSVGSGGFSASMNNWSGMLSGGAGPAAADAGQAFRVAAGSSASPSASANVIPNSSYMDPRWSKPSAGKTSGNLMTVLQKAGFVGEGLKKAWAIAMAESSGRESARNKNSNGTTDVGIFQLNSSHSAWLNMGRAQKDIDYNAHVAFQMSKGGSDWSAWATYGGSRYKNFLKNVPGYAKGSWEIPGDHLAMVHKKEMILPASLAEAVRSSIQGKYAGGSGNTYQFNVTLQNGSRAEVERMFDNIKQVADERDRMATIGKA